MRKLRRLNSILFIFLILIPFVQAQPSDDNDSELIRRIIAEFSLAPAPSKQFFLSCKPLVDKSKKDKNWLRAHLESQGLNVAIWIWDWPINRYEWANISIKSVAENIKHGFIWDDDSFQCNQIKHPYHGAMLFSLARSSGLNFWKSAIPTFLGTLVWEVALETCYPSINDMIMTTLPGIVFGEALFRLSGLVIDESSKGVERAIREVLAFFINPSVSADRLVAGRIFRIGGGPKKQDYSLEFQIGASQRITGRNFELGLDLEYKDTLNKDRFKIYPYDYFRFSLGTFDYEGLKVEKVLVSGILFGKRARIFSNNKNLIGLFADFDYIGTRHNKISTIGIGPGWVADFNFGRDLFLKTFGVAEGIFGGSTSSFALKYGRKIFSQYSEDYRFGPEGEPYYLGPGVLGKLNLEFGQRRLWSISTGFWYHWVRSIFGTNANEYVTRCYFRAQRSIVRWLGVGLEYEIYFRKGTYRDYPPLYKDIPSFRIFSVLKF